MVTCLAGRDWRAKRSLARLSSARRRRLRRRLNSSENFVTRCYSHYSRSSVLNLFVSRWAKFALNSAMTEKERDTKSALRPQTRSYSHRRPLFI